MKTKVSKTMVKTLNKELKKRDFTNIDEFIYDNTLDENMYYLFVDNNIFNHGNDYNEKTRTFKAINIKYRHGCCANAVYITTNDLIDIAKKTHCDYEKFINEIFNTYEI